LLTICHRYQKIRSAQHFCSIYCYYLVTKAKNITSGTEVQEILLNIFNILSGSRRPKIKSFLKRLRMKTCFCKYFRFLKSNLVVQRHQETLLIVIFYSLSFWLVAVNQGVYWDDWVLYHVAPEWRALAYDQTSRPFLGMLVNFFFLISEEVVFIKIFGFIYFLIPMFVLNGLLKDVKEITEMQRLMIVLFFGLFPVTSSRSSIVIILQYGFSYCLFFIAFGVTRSYLKNRSKLLRGIAIVLFFFSFYMESLLVFFSLVALYIFYFHRNDIVSLKSFVLHCVKYTDFLVLPFVFFFIRLTFFKPHGLYEGYNEISWPGIRMLLGRFFLSFKYTFWDFWTEGLKVFEEQLPLFVIMSLVVFFLLKRNYFVDSSHARKPNIKLILLFLGVGTAFLIIAVFPYAMIGHIPQKNDWNSRHQILIPLSASFLVYYGIELGTFIMHRLVGEGGLLNFSQKTHTQKLLRYVKPTVCSLILALFIVMNNVMSLEYVRDWHKQLSVMYQFENSVIVRNHTSFLFFDHTLHLNANKRGYRSYELTGMMKYVFGDETRFGSSNENAIKNIENMIYYPQHNYSQFVLKPYEYRVYLKPGSYTTTKFSTLETMFDLWFSRKRNNESVRNLISLHYEIM
jgi:hypothetical protein